MVEDASLDIFDRIIEQIERVREFDEILNRIVLGNFLSCPASSFLPAAILARSCSGGAVPSSSHFSRTVSYSARLSMIACRFCTCASSFALTVFLVAAFVVFAGPSVPAAGRAATIEAVVTRAAAAAVTAGVAAPSATMPGADLGSTSPSMKGLDLSRELRVPSGNCLSQMLHNRECISTYSQSTLQPWQVTPPKAPSLLSLHANRPQSCRMVISLPSAIALLYDSPTAGAVECDLLFQGRVCHCS